jgi:hypothetical protein
MRTSISIETTVSGIQRSQRPVARASLHLPAATVALFAVVAAYAAQPLFAQAPAAPTASAAAHKPIHPHKRPIAAHPAVQPAPTPAPEAIETPPAPKPPDWPANDHPTAASVVWDSHGLRISANNSSLEQILHDFSTATGAKVEGLNLDERIFGDYGPGQARDVLSQLLDGSGYNVLLIGDQGQGAPRQIVLSPRQTAGGMQQPGAMNRPGSNDDDAEVDDQPQQPNPMPMPAQMRPGFAPGGQPRTPQQIMQEMQQRQQQMQQNNPQ